MRRLTRTKVSSNDSRHAPATNRRWIVPILGVAAIVACAPEPEPLDRAELVAGIAVARPQGWTMKLHPAGGYKLIRNDRARVRELDLVAYPQDEVGVSSSNDADVARVRGMLIAKRFESHVLSETELQGLYKSFLAGYSFHAFEKLEANGRLWGIHTQVRRGRKTQFWVTAFTPHAGHYAVIVTFVDADAQHLPPALEEWEPHLRVMTFTP